MIASTVTRDSESPNDRSQPGASFCLSTSVGQGDLGAAGPQSGRQGQGYRGLQAPGLEKTGAKL